MKCLTLAISLVLCTSAYASHTTDELKEGDLIAVSMACGRPDAAAIVWENVVKNTAVTSDDDDLVRGQCVFSTTHHVPLRIIDILASALAEDSDRRKHMLYLVAFRLSTGKDVWSVVWDTDILERGDKHDHRTDRR